MLFVMKRNMGSLDRILRFLAGAVLAGLFFGNVISGTLGIVLLLVALVFIATSFVGFCPLYAPLGIKTCRAPSTT